MQEIMHSVAESPKPAHALVRAIGSAVVLAASVFVGACHSRDEIAPMETSMHDNPIRHAPEPLTKRFPEIGKPISATWMSGTLGAQSDSRVTVPGPSVYWIEAIIELEPATTDTLRSKYAPTASGETPNLNGNLRTEVPAGTYLTSTALDTALSNDDWRSIAYLHSGSHTLVLRSVDD
ncbi:hypothetical protein [Mycolicibacterium nivoides]|uniref:hypothetical protein n=1 Tax=Mycolicibacterium nivoides TaxID=2487344 RepID=UPI000F5BF175|nr:hypothetical protein [Mycolicibacterium nivoides]